MSNDIFELGLRNDLRHIMTEIEKGLGELHSSVFVTILITVSMNIYSTIVAEEVNALF